jgi:F-type H+-transporting ATPase subunit b
VTRSPRGRRRPVSGRAAAAVRAAILVIVLAAAASLAGSAPPVVAAAPPPAHAPAAAAVEQAGGEAGGSAHEGASPWALVARLFNFALLAGTLVYFLRSPFVAFLARRGSEIRSSLIRAAELRAKSANQLAVLDRRLAALPAEIEALRTRGTADVAAEEARILAAAEAERARLVEQARREVDFQLRVARRELVAHAADLAVAVASERIRKTIRDDDQRRLVEAYLSQVRAAPGPGAARLPAGGQP